MTEAGRWVPVPKAKAEEMRRELAQAAALQQAPQAPPSVPPQSRMPRPRSGAQPVGGNRAGYQTGGRVPDHNGHVPHGQQPPRSTELPTRSSQPPAGQYSSGIDTAHHVSVQREGGWFRRHPRTTTIGVIAAAAVFAGGLYVSGHERGDEAGTQAAGSDVLADTEVTQELAVETTPIESLSAEALSPDNCMVEGAGVATIYVSGRMPLNYNIEESDGSPKILSPYFTDPYTTGYTESGYAEFQMENTPITVYACEENATDTATTGAVIEEDGQYTLNFNKVTFDAKVPSAPDAFQWTQYKTDSKVLGSAQDGEHYWYWPNIAFPAQESLSEQSTNAATEFSIPYVDPKAEKENITLTKAVTDTYSIAVDSVLRQASVASGTTNFNQLCTFPDGTENLATIIKEATKQRITSDPSSVSSAGSVQNIGGDTFDKAKKVEVINFAEERADRFIITECAVFPGEAKIDPATAAASSAEGSN